VAVPTDDDADEQESADTWLLYWGSANDTGLSDDAWADFGESAALVAGESAPVAGAAMAMVFALGGSRGVPSAEETEPRKRQRLVDAI
jgi:hypothetical protein